MVVRSADSEGKEEEEERFNRAGTTEAHIGKKILCFLKVDHEVVCLHSVFLS